MKLEVNLPDELLDEDGNAYEATGDFRKPEKEEFFIGQSGIVKQHTYDNKIGPRLIVVPKFEDVPWPSWLPGWGFTIDEDGEVNWWSQKPRQTNNYYIPDKPHTVNVEFDGGDLCALFPSIAVALKQLKFDRPFRNPNYKED